MILPVLILLTIFTHPVMSVDGWQIQLDLKQPEINMGTTTIAKYNITNEGNISKTIFPIVISLRTTSEDSDIATITEQSILKNLILNRTEELPLQEQIEIKGEFLGLTKIKLELINDASQKILAEFTTEITITRGMRTVDKVFTVSVAIIVSLIYINFGCALKWNEISLMLKTPFAPCLGLLCQFIIMPLLALGIGELVFPNDPSLRLGLLFVGVSPAGGASNVWTCVLDGNVDLSVTMTALGTLASFATMPFWLFTIGKALFENANINVPYAHIASIACSLIIPLGIGWLLQRRTPKFAAFLAKKLKILSALFIIFIVIFALITNLHMLKLFNLTVSLAGAVLPWTGFLIGFLVAMIARRPIEDALAIAIETGVQNTGIAIFLLRWTLPQPQADLTTVLPVAVAIATPVPLFLLWVVFKVKNFYLSKSSKFNYEPNSIPTITFKAPESD